ncbi:MAG: hypothetical protein IKJ35_04420 [Clostridia bacterium]|nr:hypothetical protein [Clostridia bacterium]
MVRSWIVKHKHLLVPSLVLGVLSVYFFYICYLNFSLTSNFYCTDMYSDVLYAVRAWETKSIFPDGWVFGNQYYVIATPVLSALVYGITGHPALSMAIASVLMTLGIAVSFLWMLKPVFVRLEERLIALLGFVALTACCGSAIYALNGWQLFFTMCSYYACYLITAFLCFGCFLRRRDALTKPRVAMLVVSALLAFGAGMQSLRQTAIMLPPMLALEAFAQANALIEQKKLQWKPLTVTLALCAANLLGALLIRLLHIPRHEIFSSAIFLGTQELSASLESTRRHLTTLLTNHESFGVFLLLAVLFVVAIGYFQSKRQKEEDFTPWNTLIALLGLSVLGIAVIDVFTTMSVRSIYYFMLFPLLAILPAYVYRHWRFGKPAVFALLAVLVVLSLRTSVLPSAKQVDNARDRVNREISELLVEKGYTTIYSGWNQCEGIVIASGGKLTAGFWDRSKEDVFRPVKYLCDPSVYRVESDKCVYYLRSDNREIALETAQRRGVDMKLVAKYPEWGIFLYEASENLMAADGQP